MRITLLSRSAAVLAAFALAVPAIAQVADVAPPSDGPVVAYRPGTVPSPVSSTFGAPLYDNGPIVNSVGTGPAGEDESILQTSLTLTLFGFGQNQAAGIRMADDFVVPAGGWNVDAFGFYGYQTGSTTTSTFTGYFMQIWDGPPDSPSSNVIFGDTTTNRMTSTDFANIYRRTDTAPGNVQRPVMLSNVAADVNLAAGTYWVEWGATGSLASGPWQPPITINGQTTTGNGKQVISGAWAEALDGTFPQGLPFLIFGSPGTAAEDGPSIAGEFGLSAPAPNPSATSAVVTVQVERAQEISVVVYDVVGRAVATLHEGHASAGSMRLSLDSSALPTGVYMVRAAGQAGTVSQALTIAR